MANPRPTCRDAGDPDNSDLGDDVDEGDTKDDPGKARAHRRARRAARGAASLPTAGPDVSYGAARPDAARLPGVFDARWAPTGPPTEMWRVCALSASGAPIAVGLADGCVAVWWVGRDEGGGGSAATATKLLAVSPPLAAPADKLDSGSDDGRGNGGDDTPSPRPSTMVVTVAWEPGPLRRLAAALSCGRAVVLSVPEEQELAAGSAVPLRIDRRWMAHPSPTGEGAVECWTVAWCSHRRGRLWTGGDDGRLCAWLVGEGESDGGRNGEGCAESSSPSPPPLEWRSGPPHRASPGVTAHGAGVCCAEPGSARPWLLATGSYDDHLRVWDVRPMDEGAPPRLVAELALGGGVWRARWHPLRGDVLLAAAMRAGTVVCVLSGCDDEDNADADANTGLAVVRAHRRQGGEALSYGCSWHATGTMVASCSFYDRSVHVWTGWRGAVES